MKIKDLGGEFSLIRRITRGGGCVVGVGDDAAVLEYDDKHYQLLTVDMLCEGDHFRRDWSTPKQVGAKAMQVNVSDIAAMGGKPTYALVSISLPEDVTVEFIDELYDGMYCVADEYGFNIVGGDTTNSKTMAISVTLLGIVEKEMLSLRSDAKEEDLICVTGDLGKSTAGLELLRNGLEGDLKAHLEPRSRLFEAQTIARFCNALIDVSDGLASEVNHICEASGVGAVIYADKVPISDVTCESATKLGRDPLDFALSGGEDFELVFTVSSAMMEKIKLDCPISVVGKILNQGEGVKLEREGEVTELVGGFNHFM